MGSLAAGIGSTALGYLGARNDLSNGLSNSAGAIQNYKPTMFNAPGYSTSTSGNTFNLTRTPEMTNALTGLSNAWGSAASGYNKLLNQVTPGYDALTASQLQQNENAKLAAVGNLRQNLQNRRVLGSSFAQDALTRANLAYDQNAQSIMAKNFVDMLGMSSQLYGQKATAQAQQFGSMIGQMNIESNLAASMTSQMNQISAANSQLLAKLYEDYAGGFAGLNSAIMGAGLSTLGYNSTLNTNYGSPMTAGQAGSYAGSTIGSTLLGLG